ncbi:membrane-spanning 4-domains subfamily A member 4A-like [Anguilla anguilla]|uniref:membrane-spanning 4-domains subfamily A member 4A-like n=1 Tax=Anguilla anguilla TaxID=7936 RepID=UPI0015B28F7D|nr:membrane-spanning 4-domains subfamily A member 4A-like [Anguilla anguilla]XP_035252241.1 membrane-spanning 4-domains subfamily A member 4A-like [Anguilla anguilla]
MARSSALGNFLKGDTKALGTVQIMIGVLHVLFGIVMATSGESNGVYLVLFFCGGLIYISSGALSVAANNNLNKCLVSGTLGMNIISTITAGIAVICISKSNPFQLGVHHPFSNIYIIHQGVIGVLLVFSILEFIISICVSAFACRAVCDCPQR